MDEKSCREACKVLNLWDGGKHEEGSPCYKDHYKDCYQDSLIYNSTHIKNLNDPGFNFSLICKITEESTGNV